MVDGEGKPNDKVRSDAGRHEEFLELCAVSTSGSLSEEEQRKLQEHLLVCSECRDAMKQFERVVDQGIPSLAAEFAKELPEEDSSFCREAAEAAFFERLSDENKSRSSPRGNVEPWLSPLVLRRSRNFRRTLDRYHLWFPLAAGLLLCATLGILAYRIGTQRGAEVNRLEKANQELPGTRQNSQAAEFETARRERDAANAQLTRLENAIYGFRHQVDRQSAEIAELKGLQSEQLNARQAGEQQKMQVVQERDRLAQQLTAQEAALEVTEKKLASIEQQRSSDVIHTTSLEARVAELSRGAKDDHAAIDQQQELLSHDRDIRELMGARDLTMSPLLPPGTFVQIDAKQTRVKQGPSKQGAGQFQFARAIYFLDIRSGYACGWCEIKDGQLTLIPHPDSGEQTRTFRYPSEVEVVGRVTGVAMRITEENFTSIEESVRLTPPKK